MSVFQRTTVRVPRDLKPITTIARDTEVPAAKAGLRDEDAKAIWLALKAVYRTGAYPALGLCLRRNGEILFNRTIGHAEGNGPADSPRAPKRLLTTDTPVCLFSASKAVTAVLIHQLAEQGGIDLDQRVSHYLPKFGRAGKSETTIADVLAHRGGFPSMDVPKSQREVTLLEDWDRVIDLICTAAPVRGRNMAYHAITGGFILAEVLQKVTGRSIQHALDAVIRKPMGMHHFTYGLPAKTRAEAAVNYVAGSPVRFPLTTFAERALFVPFADVVAASNTETFKQAVIPAGNVYATAEELSRFFQMLLDGGVWQGRRVLSEATVERAVRPVGRMSLDRTLMILMRYSEGMMLGARPAGLYGPDTARAFGHLGFMNILGWADPQRNVSAALLTTGKAILGTHLIALGKLLATISKRCA